MKASSRMCLGLAKHLPRGYWPLIRMAATRDACLQDLTLGLEGIPISLRADLRESVFVPLYLYGRIPHQFGLDQFFRNYLRHGDRVFDIGANVGYTAALFSSLVGEEGRVLAIEPSPRAFFFLHRSLAEVRNVQLINTGVSSREGNLVLFEPSMLDRASLIPIADADQVIVALETVDTLAIRHGNPAVIKVDVEGHEPEVLSGAKATLAREDRPIIVFEALDGVALHRSLDVLERLSDRGYRYMRIRNDGALVPVLSVDGSSDYVAIPEWANSRILPHAA